jgi:AraC family transcriptional regulator
MINSFTGTASLKPSMPGAPRRFPTPVSSAGQRTGRDQRTRLFDSSVGTIENLVRCGTSPRSAEDYSAEFQVCLPYRGLFVWHVGGDDVVGDPNQVIFVRAGETYRMSAPVHGGYAEVIVTPHVDLMAEIAGVHTARALREHAMFRRRAGLAPPSLQAFRSGFLHWATSSSDVDQLQADDSMIKLLQAAFQGDGRWQRAAGPTTTRLIRRTKEFVQARLTTRLRLADIGRAVEASPAYLTDVFRRVEGIPLHRYVTRLRLGRALTELPQTADLTALALDLGFSSHSHFSASFRRAYGCSPSEFRNASRRFAAAISGRLQRSA